jgi:cell division protein FtsI (penicillin-binding protein 3)
LGSDTSVFAIDRVAWAAKIVFIVIALIFFARLFYLQVVVADEYQSQAEESRTISFDIAPKRGTIYDRNGIALAVSVATTTVYCNPSEVTNATYEAAAISNVLGGSPSDYMDALTADDLSFSYVKRQGDVEAAAKLEELDLDGIYFIEEYKREYPYGSVAGQVIGVCNLNGEGLTGLEYEYDDILTGTAGSYSAERGLTGTPIPGGVHEDTPAVDGQDIQISIDISFQASVESALASGLDSLGAELGSSVVMDSSTGEIYAAVSYPFFNPADLENSESGSENLTCVTQIFEPGSIFKTISAAAVLNAGALEPSDSMVVPSYFQADEYYITDAHDRGTETMTFADILDKSSNVGISMCVQKIGFNELYNMIDKLGFGDDTGIDYPGEGVGLLEDVDDWSDIMGYNISFGQGIAVTPLQMVRAYSAFANDGSLVTPHFVIAMPQTGEHITKESTKVIDNTEALDKLKTMLRGVVTSGTGKTANIDGYEVVGKTSTAEIAENGVYLSGIYNLAFTGFIDNSSSDLVCFVGANEVGSEANVCSIFKEIMQSAIEQYNIVPE